jgi:ribosomal protein S18 acetylase RimI-like enzyme
MTQSNPSPSAAIRRAVPEDSAALAGITAATFIETFGHLYPPEDLQEFLARTCTPEACRRTLEDPAHGVWLATIGKEERTNEEPIGFVVVGPCKLPVENLEPKAGEVKQLYVLAKYHNLRLGSRLLSTSLDWLATEGRTPLYVGVWSENYGAQRLYERHGFAKSGEYGFPVGKTIDREFILKR